MSFRSERVIFRVAPLGAGVIGVLSAALFALVPSDLLESMVVDSGIAAVLPVAAPPLGVTARLVLVVLCGGGVALAAWLALSALFGRRAVVLRWRRRQRTAAGDAPVLRRTDAHPDAPPRRPLFANTDLGTPFLEVRARPAPFDGERVSEAPDPIPAAAIPSAPAERALPADLDQPLAAFDPDAVPERPAAYFPPPPPLNPAPLDSEPRRQTFDAGERFEVFALTPPARRGDPAETIQALLDRLERVAARRPAGPLAPPPAETLGDTLSTLRAMAAGIR